MTATSSSFPLRLGTRSSALALAQARMAAAALEQMHGFAAGSIELVPVQTVGDRVQDRALSEIGGKALWTKELDGALLDGRIDLAVHSMKDVETWLPAGIVVAAVLPRADPRDRLLGAASLAEIPPGMLVGTSSPRRAAQLLNRRPDLRVGNLRGNVETRIRQVTEGRVGASFLAAAGLDRLGIKAGVSLPIDDWLPASAQGIIGITCRADDQKMRSMLAAINDTPTFTRLTAERAVLEAIGGDCHTSIAVHADFVPGLRLRAELLSADGKERVEAMLTDNEDPRQLGQALAQILLQRASPAVRATISTRGTN